VSQHAGLDLNERHFAELMGEGPGAAIDGAAILQPVPGALSEEG
jgi:hypothetical protein